MEGLDHTLLTECIRERPEKERRQDDRTHTERAAAQPLGAREIHEWKTHRTLAVTDSESDPCSRNAQRGDKRDAEPSMSTMKAEFFDDDDSAREDERGACDIGDPSRSVELFGAQMDDDRTRYSSGANENPTQKATAFGVHCSEPIMQSNEMKLSGYPARWRSHVPGESA